MSENEINTIDNIDVAKKGLVVAGLAISTLSSCFLLYQVLKKYTKLKLACLICNLSIVALATVHFIQFLAKSINSNVYWLAVAIENTIYTTMLVTFILEMGRKFYQNIHWNTIMFKLTLFGLLLFNILNLTSTIFFINDIIKQPRYIIWIIKMIAGMLTTMLACVYTFNPVIRLYWDSSTSKTGQINPKNAAAATWYLVLLATLSVLYLILYITALFSERAQKHLPLTTAIDTILRSTFPLILGSPPPKQFINTAKYIFINRRPLNNAIRDRGVST
ncbi:2943_t:CDS:2 [Ambispora gerdemannii]|uniref:2943_t:CDS:1 n=1 Tax=Ambispora gerdemannii TaxID=144530 RepID=A0A9N9GTK0_9GLOM|nr:2943_t:CDS:2 [Ambispora gerdemannii]